MNPKDQTDNSNYQFEPKPTLQEVDDLAAELCHEYSNPNYYRWYCRAIHVLGVRRVNEIRAMYRDTPHAKHLFSRRAAEEMRAKLGQEKLIKLKGEYGKKKDSA